MKVVSREQFSFTFNNLKEDLKCQQELHLSVFNSNSLSLSLSQLQLYDEKLHNSTETALAFPRLRLFHAGKILFLIYFPRSRAIALDDNKKLQKKIVKNETLFSIVFRFLKNNI